jgi:hypothetical protein
MVRYFWVDFLSHATSWSGFGCYTSTITLSMLSPSLLLLWFPVRVENMIWGDGNGTCLCDAGGSRFCPVR